MSRQELRHDHSPKLQVKNSPDVFKTYITPKPKVKIKRAVIKKSSAMPFPVLVMVFGMGTLAIMLLSSALEQNRAVIIVILMSAFIALLIANQTTNKLIASIVWIVITAGALGLAIAVAFASSNYP